MELFNHEQLLQTRMREQDGWIIDGLVRAKSIGFVAAYPKVGKSFLTLHMGMAVSTGTEFLGHFRVPSARRVLIVQVEDAAATVAVRYKLLETGMHTPKPIFGYFNLMIGNDIKLDNESSKELFRAVEEIEPDLIILDVLNKLHTGSESSQRQATIIMNMIENLRAMGPACLVVHHFEKGSPNKTGNQRLRGSSVLAGWSENSLYLSRQGDIVSVEVENKFAPTPNFKYRLESTPSATRLVYLENPEEQAVKVPGEPRSGVALIKHLHRHRSMK